MKIRDYTAADWSAVCSVHDLARPLELERAGVDAAAFLAMKEAAEDDEFFASETLVACMEERVVGFVSWSDSYITWFYVDPRVHGCGVGSELLREAIAQIGPQAWTSTMDGNEVAIHVFEKSGMELVRRRASECEGFPCTTLRLALRTSRMHCAHEERVRGSGA